MEDFEGKVEKVGNPDREVAGKIDGKINGRV